jgi:putative transposase
MTRKIPFEVGEYYHIYNRGVDKRDIFLVKNDHERFLALLYLCNTKKGLELPKDFVSEQAENFFSTRLKPLVDICAYCLMSNHFHILLREKAEGGVSAFMQKLMTAYTMYFNNRNERSGALFQGTFKAEHAGNDTYLKYLIAYIHLNPVKIIEPKWRENGLKDRKRAQEYLEIYKYSSYQDFYGIQRPQNNILTKGSLPEYFETPISFKENIREFLDYNIPN